MKHGAQPITPRATPMRWVGYTCVIAWIQSIVEHERTSFRPPPLSCCSLSERDSCGTVGSESTTAFSIIRSYEVSPPTYNR